MHGSRPRLRKVLSYRLAAACGLVALVLLPGLARAQSASEAEARTLARARAALESVDHEAARIAVRPLLASPAARVRVSALEITAVADLLVGRLVAGRQALEQLYTLAPAFLLDDPTLPPRVTSEFEAAAARPRARAVAPVVQAAAGGPDRFELRAAGATRRVTIACRTSPGEPYVALTTTPTSGGWGFELPRSTRTMCHAVALDEEDLAIGRLGTPQSPFELRPRAASTLVSPSPPSSAPAPAQESSPITTRWWFWTGVAAVVIAGAAVTYVATRPSEATLPESEVTISTVKGAALAW